MGVKFLAQGNNSSSPNWGIKRGVTKTRMGNQETGNRKWECARASVYVQLLWPRCEGIRKMDEENKPDVIDLTCDSDTGSESFSDSSLDMKGLLYGYLKHWYTHGF